MNWILGFLQGALIGVGIYYAVQGLAYAVAKGWYKGRPPQTTEVNLNFAPKQSQGDKSIKENKI